MNWILRQKAVYFGNAGAVKDYRVQLRGNRAIWFWMAYLAFLAFFALVNYSTANIGGTRSVAEIQGQLYGFYLMIIQTVQTVVLLVAPVLASQGIVSEHERQSYDLVMSAPVTPKYFLVGKLISGMRTLVLLLVLSVPVASLGVIMGGATWADVFYTYGHLFLQGLIVMAFSMPLAVMTKKMPATVGYVYITLAVTGILSGMTGALSLSGMGGVSAPYYAGLLPYLPALLPSSTTLVGAVEVPNLVLAALIALVFVKLCLVGAGSAMSRARSAETKSLRVHGVVAAGLLGLFVAFTVPPMAYAGMGATAMGGMGSGASAGVSTFADPTVFMVLMATFVTFICLPFVPFLPYVSTFGYEDERKYYATGWFQVREVFTGSPGGGLPYLLLVLILALGPFGYVCVANGVSFDLVAGGIGWALAFAVFMWSCGWAMSAASRSASTARRGAFGIFLAVTILPVVFLGFVQGMTFLTMETPTRVWAEFSPFHAFSQDSVTAILKIPVLLAFALFLGSWAERRRMTKAKEAGVF